MSAENSSNRKRHGVLNTLHISLERMHASKVWCVLCYGMGIPAVVHVIINGFYNHESFSIVPLCVPWYREAVNINTTHGSCFLKFEVTEFGNQTLRCINNIISRSNRKVTLECISHTLCRLYLRKLNRIELNDLTCTLTHVCYSLAWLSSVTFSTFLYTLREA